MAGLRPVLHWEADGVVGVSTSSPIGAKWKAYTPAPFAAKNYFNNPNLSFSPDGKSLLYCLDSNSRQIWLLPWPSGGGSPRSILASVPGFGTTPIPSWLPDSRHLILSIRMAREVPNHLYLTDIDSGSLTPVTGGVGSQENPAVSPDGGKIIYAERQRDMNLVSVSLADASVVNLMETERVESMPAWSSGQPRMVYVTNRNGPQEIWTRRVEGNERPLVTAAAFPPGTIKWLMTPALSPDATRVIYLRVETSNANRLWISSVSGGPPVRLTDAEVPLSKEDRGRRTEKDSRTFRHPAGKPTSWP